MGMKAWERAPSPKRRREKLGIVRTKKKISLRPAEKKEPMRISLRRPNTREVAMPKDTTVVLRAIFLASGEVFGDMSFMVT